MAVLPKDNLIRSLLGMIIISDEFLDQLKSSNKSTASASIYLSYNLPRSIDDKILQKLKEFRETSYRGACHSAARHIEHLFEFASRILHENFRQHIFLYTKELFHITPSEQYVEQLAKRVQQILNIHRALYLAVIGKLLPHVLYEKIELILKFYQSHRHLINAKTRRFIVDCVESEKKQTRKEECDVVIGIKLKFWPQITHSRLNYLRQNKHRIYDIIKNGIVYLIPKWCGRTSLNDDAPYEFRYSFSEVEGLLANSRTVTEQTLNKIARAIFYKHIRKLNSEDEADSENTPNYVKSYFIKTCVLWICEENNIYKQNFDEHQLTTMFIEYAKEKLKSNYCAHYFIEGINILNDYDQKVMNDVHEILCNVQQEAKDKTDEKGIEPEMTICANIFDLEVQQLCELIENFRRSQSKHFGSYGPLYL
ncbi:unnamed protein product, partial [Didymodactylos carnosus]